MRIGNVQYGPLRGKVTRACKSGDVEKILKTAREVVNFFDAHGWPDNWAGWRNDLVDALGYTYEVQSVRYAVEDLFR